MIAHNVILNVLAPSVDGTVVNELKESGNEQQTDDGVILLL